ncbi:MAG: hypothetical protein OHK0039_28870 [Bacteroidia bacterium]
MYLGKLALARELVLEGRIDIPGCLAAQWCRKMQVIGPHRQRQAADGFGMRRDGAAGRQTQREYSDDGYGPVSEHECVHCLGK